MPVHGVVFRNPKPYLRSVHAFHPSLVRVSDTDLVCSYDVGDAVEGLDYATHLSRSTDGGETWTSEGPILRNPPPKTTHSIRISRFGDGTFAGMGALFSGSIRKKGS